ncbi:glycosyltransferase [Acinetobacter sp. YH12219]|uniref:glycosyltransferase n=1 Tax=Acinetobacter sp. YH12219 TaxID=2601153 RepID=UPI0015D45241|nr:glycosyltransferase [Acinetobacter sp. YH12219]
MILFNFYKVKKNSAVDLAYQRIFQVFSSRTNCRKIDNNLSNEKYIVCSDMYQVILTFFINFGRPHIIFWVQGSSPHESYLKHKSYIKYMIIWILEYVALFLSNSHIYVSPYMKTFYQKKPFLNKKKNIVIPCFSDLKINKSVKRDQNNYCYIGGMSKWQNFDIIIKMMNIIVENNNEAKFSVATNDLAVCHAQLKELATAKLLKVTSVVSLSSKQEIENFLSAASFGFLIRDDIVVNNVASPIKLAEYLSCGVNVISTKGITSYKNLIEQAGYIVNDKNLDSIREIKFEANEEKALQVFQENFSSISISNSVNIFLKELGL